MEFIREDCIYARQSVDRKDSISIESQIDFCKYELKGGSCRVFKDKGYSGKNTDRPEFQKLLGEIRTEFARYDEASAAVRRRLEQTAEALDALDQRAKRLSGKLREISGEDGESP